ncbi:MAG: oxygenase MpaB family protein [Thermoleophilaceae bacterium]
MARAEHDGLLGPDSVAWRVLDHPAALIGGLRALIVQALHPLAMAGVAQHSDYRRRPLERLRRTAYYVGATAMGDTATALAAAERVKRVHKRVRGIDPVTGRAYSAEDPDTQVWVHTVEWHSFLVAYNVFARRLSPEEQDRYMAEGVRIATLVGTPADLVPASTSQLHDYFEQVTPQLCVSNEAREAIGFVVNPPLSRDLLPYWAAIRVLGQAAVAIVPRRLRRLAGIDRPRALDAAAVATVRPLVAASRVPPLRELYGYALGRDVRDVHVRGREVRRRLAA